MVAPGSVKRLPVTHLLLMMILVQYLRILRVCFVISGWRVNLPAREFPLPCLDLCSLLSFHYGFPISRKWFA